MTTLDFEPLTVVVPLREEPAGVLRVGKSRVLLELVLHAFKAGATPEAIVQSYDTLKLADVYAVVSRYLSAPEPFEEYLRIREEVAEVNSGFTHEGILARPTAGYIDTESRACAGSTDSRISNGS